MTADKEKIPYIECLYRTGKIVYKWWFITLAAIGVIAGLGFVILSAWSQIVDGFNYIAKSVFGIYSSIDGCIGYVLSILGAIPWYWWVGIGVVAGPLLIVAVYCALKRLDTCTIDLILFGIVVGITIASIVVLLYIINKIFYGLLLNIGECSIGILSLLWLICMYLVTTCGDISV
jgi:hypothetical protein